MQFSVKSWGVALGIAVGAAGAFGTQDARVFGLNDAAAAASKSGHGASVARKESQAAKDRSALGRPVEAGPERPRHAAKTSLSPSRGTVRTRDQVTRSRKRDAERDPAQ